MDEDQERYLDDAKKVIKEQAYFMNKALSQANLRDALRYAAIMLSELKTSQLTPRNYYLIFMDIFDEMRVLESHFKDEYRRGRNMKMLYESVQHATNLIPRLYLLITVGSVYIQAHVEGVGAKKILQDLLDMIKAVQHPLRGLFVRYYFLKMCKDRLPDKGSEYEGEGGDINDAIEIISTNLTEMNKLWIRMSGGSKDKPKREKERIDLKVIVGENILRLASLEGVNIEVYQSTVLPKILELVTQSKDFIAQQYLIDVTIQAFPDDYHLATLQELLDVCTTKLDPKVDIKTIFIRLMERLADYALNPENNVSAILGDSDIYEMFKRNIDRMVDTSVAMEFKNVLDLIVAFLRFTLRCYVDNTEYVNAILRSCVKICERQHASDFDEDCQKNIVKFLTLPLDTISLQVLTMKEYPNLMKYLPYAKRRQVATRIVNAVVQLGKKLDDIGTTKQYLEFISPLLRTEPGSQESEDSEFIEEQNLVARSLHLVDNQNLKTKWQILQLFFDRFKEGGVKRQRITYPASFFAVAKIARQFFQANTEGLNYITLFETMKEYVDAIAQQNQESALNLYLQLVLVISEIDTQKEHDEFTYDIACQAMTIYTDEITDSQAKLRTLNLIIGSLNVLSAVTDENYDTLTTNATQYASKLLKKNEQCLAVLKCTHLFYNNQAKDDNNVFQCIKKCLKLAGMCIKQGPKNVDLFVHILNKLLYYVLQKVTTIKDSDVQECIDIIKTNIAQIEKDNDAESVAIKNYWNNSVKSIVERRNQGVEGFEKLQI